MTAMPWNVDWREHPAYVRWQSGIGGRPAWVTRIALTAAVLVIVVPLVLLVLTAIFVGVLVFAILSAAAWVMSLFSSLGPHTPRMDDGRRNVRVIERP